MFNKTKNYLKKKAKNVMSSGRLKAMALMLLVGCGAAMAQNSAGDYTAGTTALTQVTEEIAKYVPIRREIVLCHRWCSSCSRCYLGVHQHEQRGAGRQEYLSPPKLVGKDKKGSDK
jgi:hypothetical protein